MTTRGKALLAAIIAGAVTVSVGASARKEDAPTAVRSIEQLQERLGALSPYAASTTYSVLLPNSEAETVYDIELQALPTALSSVPCNYFITARQASQPEKSFGFTAYCDGDYFNYSDERLREYHVATDSGDSTAGDHAVKSDSRFTRLLPTFILLDVNRITSDSTFTYSFDPETTFAGRKAVRLDAVERVRGYDVCQLSYIFDAESGTPLRLSFENNPGTQYEQSVTVDYAAPRSTTLDDFSEATLSALYRDIFDRLRERDLHLENLVGTSMPQFSYPTLTGDRYTYRRGQVVSRPILIAVIDPESDSTTTAVNAVREAVAGAEQQLDILWAVNSRHVDTIEALLLPTRSNETILIGATSIVRNCGISELPAVILVNNDGVIQSVACGDNKNLSEIVIKMTEEL